MGISTHVLDTERGRPAAGVKVALHRLDDAGPAVDVWSELAAGITDADGRCRTLVPDGQTAERGVYRLRFETGPYYTETSRDGTETSRVGLYPYVEIVFAVRDARHHHIPLLLTANGYSTYRGS